MLSALACLSRYSRTVVGGFMPKTSALLAALVGSLLTFGPAAAASLGWRFEEVTDPVTDAKRGIASMTGDQGAVAIKCDQNGPDSIYVHVVARKYLGALRNARRSVVVRLDDGPLQNYSWYHDKADAIFTDDIAAPTLALRLAYAKKIVIRMTTYEGEYVDLLFTSNGDGTPVERAFATCGQTMPGPTKVDVPLIEVN